MRGLMMRGLRSTCFDAGTGVQATLINVLARLALQDPDQGARSTLFAAAADIPGGSFVQPGGLHTCADRRKSQLRRAARRTPPWPDGCGTYRPASRVSFRLPA